MNFGGFASNLRGLRGLRNRRDFLPGASLDLRFDQDKYKGVKRSDLVFVRATPGTAQDLNGVWKQFAAGQMRQVPGRGVLIEEARSNLAGSPRMQGASVGSNTLPTGWLLTNAPTVTVLGLGIEDGIDYIDLRITGGAVTYAIELGAFTPASSGQVWTGSLFAKLLAGSIANVTLQVGVQEGGGIGQYNTAFVPNARRLGLQRYTSTSNALSGPTTSVRTRLRLAATAGFSFDIRLGWPQLEQGAWASSPSPDGARDADSLTLPIGSWWNAAQGALFAEAEANPNDLSGLLQVALAVDDAAVGTDRIHLRRTATGTAQATFVDAGASVALLTGSAWAAGSRKKQATAFALNDFAYADGGIAAAVVDTLGVVPTVSTLSIGRPSSGTVNNINSYVKRAAVFPKRLPDAELVRLTR